MPPTEWGFVWFFDLKKKKNTHLKSKSPLILGHRFVIVSSVKWINFEDNFGLLWLGACLMYWAHSPPFSGIESIPRVVSYKAILAYSTPSPNPSCHSQQHLTKCF